MIIRKLTDQDMEVLWSLRLQAIRDSPEVFGDTYEEAIAYGNTWLLQRLGQGDDMFYLGAFEEFLIGMVGFRREEGVKNCHKGYVLGLYVLPEQRGKGAGKALMLELIERVQQQSGLKQLLLGVDVGNIAACHLYRSLGFEVYGRAPEAVKPDNQYHDEYLMILRLRS